MLSLSTCERSSLFVPNVTEPVKVFLWGLERLVIIPDMHRLLCKVQEQRLGAIVRVDDFVGLTGKQLGTVSTCFIIHHLKMTTKVDVYCKPLI